MHTDLELADLPGGALRRREVLLSVGRVGGAAVDDVAARLAGPGRPVEGEAGVVAGAGGAEAAAVALDAVGVAAVLAAGRPGAGAVPGPHAPPRRRQRQALSTETVGSVSSSLL